MKKITVLGFLCLAAAAALATGGAPKPAASAAKANGEIIGIVESGSTRVSDAVVSLTDVSGSFAAPSAPVIMNQKDKEFTPMSWRF